MSLLKASVGGRDCESICPAGLCTEEGPGKDSEASLWEGSWGLHQTARVQCHSTVHAGPRRPASEVSTLEAAPFSR